MIMNNQVKQNSFELNLNMSNSADILCVLHAYWEFGKDKSKAVPELKCLNSSYLDNCESSPWDCWR